jgi:hypothetical protein
MRRRRDVSSLQTQHNTPFPIIIPPILSIYVRLFPVETYHHTTLQRRCDDGMSPHYKLNTIPLFQTSSFPSIFLPSLFSAITPATTSIYISSPSCPSMFVCSPYRRMVIRLYDDDATTGCFHHTNPTPYPFSNNYPPHPVHLCSFVPVHRCSPNLR